MITVSLDWIAQQVDGQLPQRRRPLRPDLVGGQERIDSSEEQQLGSVHVADPGHDRLVEQQAADLGQQRKSLVDRRGRAIPVAIFGRSAGVSRRK